MAILRVVAIGVLVLFVLFLVNQTAQIVQLANTIDQGAGRIVLVGLLVFYAFVLGVPLSLVASLPKPLRPPARIDSPEHATYLARLSARLARNPHLRGVGVEADQAGIKRAFEALDKLSKEEIRKAAKAAFISTAISQNGRLDTLMVLANLTRLVWTVTRIYNQRPSVGEWVSIYSSIGAAVLLANQAEEINIAEQIEPVIGSVLGSAVVGVIPGVAMVASIARHLDEAFLHSNQKLDVSANGLKPCALRPCREFNVLSAGERKLNVVHSHLLLIVRHERTFPRSPV